MSKNCKTCASAISSRSKYIECGFCLLSYHGKCVQLSDSQIKTIPGFYWKCPTCTQKTEVIQINSIENETENKNLLEIIKDLKQAINDLKDEVRLLKEEKKESFNIESVINEINDRKRREKNIIIFKMKEKENGSASEKSENDKITAVEMLKKLSNDIDFSGISTYRLGKNSNQSRPLKVCLKSTEDVLKIIKNKKLLANFDYDVNIAMDNTLLQREYYKKIKSELDMRKQAGEKDIFIKYSSGTPFIAKQKLYHTQKN